MARSKKPVSLEFAMDDSVGREEAVVDSPSAPPKPAKQGPEKMTVYLPRAAARRLKQMALDHDRRVNDFLQEGVDLMLAKYGQPSIKDFEKK